MTYREIIYSILEQSKSLNDDITITEEHILFIIDKLRAMLLTQKYKTVKAEVLESNYQTLCITMDVEEGNNCGDGYYLKSIDRLPSRLNIGNDIVSPYDYYKGLNMSLVPKERMRYVGTNKFLKNILFFSFGPDGYLYGKSNNPQFAYLLKVKITAVFENTVEASNFECNKDCELLDRIYPLEEPLAQTLIETAVKIVTGAEYRPADQQNDANDNLSDLYAYIAKNSKSSLAKQLE